MKKTKIVETIICDRCGQDLENSVKGTGTIAINNKEGLVPIIIKIDATMAHAPADICYRCVIIALETKEA